MDEAGLTHLIHISGQVVVKHGGAGGAAPVLDHFEKADGLADGGNGRGPVTGVDGRRGGLGAVEETGRPGVDAPRVPHRDLTLLAGALTHLSHTVALHKGLGRAARVRIRHATGRCGRCRVGRGGLGA